VARRAAAHEPAPVELTFSNDAGALGTMTTAGAFEPGNPFFEDLGTNGRTCATCHRPAQAWTITPVEVRERFEQSAGLDPIFRTNDGSNCEGADVSTIDRRRRAFSLLLTKGLIRIGLDVPDGAEFEIVSVDDPYRCGAPLTSASLYRRPLPTTNLAFLSAIMWDGRASFPGHAVRDDLVAQALDATMQHAGGAAPTPAQLRGIVDFELGVLTAQTRDHAAGNLRGGGARGGPGALTTQEFCLGINDPLGMRPSAPGACLGSGSFDPLVFRLFGAWQNAGAPERQAVARGESIFNTRQFVIDSVPGLNGGPQDPVSGPIRTGTCTVCHDTPNAGNHSVSMALNIGISDPSRRTADLPLYTLRNKVSGDVVQTTDLGRAMVTGKWKDMAKFKGPILRALAARAPYFHDGSAAGLADVVEFYDTRFRVQLADREKADLIAFLRAL
jgi:cytochrome c peroxidase